MRGNITDQLRETKLFSECSEDQLEAIAELTGAEEQPRGSVLCRQGEPGRRWYHVMSGKLRALHIDPQGVEREVDRLEGGDSFGESSLLLGEPHDATVEVVEDARLLYVERERFNELLDEWPSILDNLQMEPEVEKRWYAPRFEWQEPGEVVVFVLHKHNVVLLRQLILPGLLLLVVLGGYFLVGSTSIAGLIVGGLLSAVPLLWTLYLILDHFNDNYILTNKRVMHDEQVPLIRQSRVGAPLSNIQNVQQVQEGILAQAFDFGDLLIQTAGEPGGQVTFREVPNPTRLQEIIFEQRDRLEAQTRAEQRAAIQDALRERFGRGDGKEETSETVGGEETSEGSDQTLPAWVLAPFNVVRYFFPALRYEEGETITWRKHWIALLRPIAPPSALILLVTLIVAWLLGQASGDRSSILVGFGLALMALIPWWLWIFEDWQNDVYKLTASRIIDVEQLPFGLREERREASLGTIQNVNLKVPSFLGRLLGFGSVTIETAGAGAFTFDHVKNPKVVQTEIFKRMERFEQRRRQERAERRRDQLLDWFSVYDQMRHPSAPRTGAGPVLPDTSGSENTEKE